MSRLIKYFQALERLKNNVPDTVPKGTKITKASVAREAGCDPSSIKSSRDNYKSLILALEEASKSQKNKKLDVREQLKKIRKKSDQYRILYEESLGRELLLLKRVYELESELCQLTKSRVRNLN